MLDSLAEALSGYSGGCGFAQLTIGEGNSQRGVAIPASAILAVETNPAVLLRWRPKSRIERAAYIRIPDFLTEQENHAVLDYAIRKQPEYQASKVETGVPDHRHSHVLMQLQDLEIDFAARILEIVPDALNHFGLPVLSEPKLEIQLTTHNEGEYYRIHNDNGTPNTAARLLTYVYYFHRQPVAFQGGQIRLYDSRVEFGRSRPAESFVGINPQNNMLLLFPSRVMHEVLPTYCSSRTFADGRFTLNGWIRSRP